MTIWNARGQHVEFPLHIEMKGEMVFLPARMIPAEARLAMPELCRGATLFADGQSVLFEIDPMPLRGRFAL